VILASDCLNQGIPPFYADEVTEVFQNILDYKNVMQFPSELDEDGNEIIEMTPTAWQLVKSYVLLLLQQIKSYVTFQLTLILNSLICEPNERLGFNEISQHPLFESLEYDFVFKYMSMGRIDISFLVGTIYAD